MATVIFECPVDGLVLTPTVRVRVVGDVVRDAAKHLHFTFDDGVELTCLNGHAWYIVGNLKLTRAVRQRSG